MMHKGDAKYNYWVVVFVWNYSFKLEQPHHQFSLVCSEM